MGTETLTGATIAHAVPGEREDGDRPGGWRHWRSVGGAVALLALLYVAVILAGDPRAASGSDAGGKLATVVAMTDHGTLVPDLGYWAEHGDPDGLHHPLWNTEAMGDRWVQATSLPFVAAAVPLWRFGGAFGVLLIPVAGGLVAAIAARRLSRQLYGGDGWAAFWLVGAAGPALFYAGDFWEHAPALGLALLAIALTLESETPRRAALAGLVAGLAVVLRAEMLLYGLAFGAACVAVGDERRRWLARPRLVIGLACGAGIPLAANAVIERLLLSHGVRDGRAAASIASGGQEAGARVTDAFVTSVGLFPDDRLLALVLGTVLVACLLVVAVHLRWPAQVSERAAVVAVVVAALLYLFRFASGLGFVPGFVVAVPLAAVGTMAARSARERVLLGTALGALPLVWLLSWSGNHLAQWGGRYLLLSGALLTILAVGAISRAGWRRPPAVLLVGLTICVATMGAAWHVTRTRTVAGAVAVVEDVPDDVVILSDVAHLGRDGGAWYGDHRWLRTARPGQIGPAAAVAWEAGARRLSVVQLVAVDEADPAAPTIDGFRPTGGATTAPYLVGEHLIIRRYERETP